MDSNRIDYMDIAKGIGVFLVILGHMPSIVPEPIRLWIFSFHMPLFYVVSGYFMKHIHNTRDLGYYIKRKTEKLLIGGYLSWATIFLLFDILVYSLGHDQIVDNITNILLGRIDRVYWFFLSLYIESVLCGIIIWFFSNVKIQSIVICVCVLIGVGLKLLKINNWRIGSSLFAMGFYYIGYLNRKYCIYEIIIGKRIVLFVSALVSVVGSAVIIHNGYPVLDINSNYHVDILVNYVIAMAGVLSILYIGQKLNNSVLKRPLSYVGRYSMIFFPVTNYVPGIFTTFFGNGIVIKVFSYVIGILVSFLLAEICAVKRYKG